MLSVIARSTGYPENDDLAVALRFTKAKFDLHSTTPIYTIFIQPGVYASWTGLPRLCGHVSHVSVDGSKKDFEFLDNTWKEKICVECVHEHGHCPMRFYRGKQDQHKLQYDTEVCLCHRE